MEYWPEKILAKHERFFFLLCNTIAAEIQKLV